MSSATRPQRCPHRVAISNPTTCLVALLTSLACLTTATVSLHGQELRDYRIVDPASHMQPWPAVDANSSKVDVLVETPANLRLAKKWRTNLTGTEKKQDKPSTEAPAEPVDKKLPQPETRNPTMQVEVVETPQPPPTKTSSPPLAATEPADVADCYQAPPLASMSTSIALPAGSLPTNVAHVCAAETPPTGDRRLYGGWACVEHHWSATCMHHRPLYFEEINAERYGYTVSYALQPVISAAKFFATIPALPYKMVVERPRDCIYTLGHYRPGSCVPRRCNRWPLNFGASAVETGVIAGLILLIP